VNTSQEFLRDFDSYCMICEEAEEMIRRKLRKKLRKMLREVKKNNEKT